MRTLHLLLYVGKSVTLSLRKTVVACVVTSSLVANLTSIVLYSISSAKIIVPKLSPTSSFRYNFSSVRGGRLRPVHSFHSLLLPSSQDEPASQYIFLSPFSRTFHSLQSPPTELISFSNSTPTPALTQVLSIPKEWSSASR